MTAQVYATEPSYWLTAHERILGREVRNILAEPRYGPAWLRAEYAVDLIRAYVVSSSRIEAAAHG